MQGSLDRSSSSITSVDSNVGILHGTNNPTPEGRWTLSFIPQKDEQYIHWDDALEIFKDYLV